MKKSKNIKYLNKKFFILKKRNMKRLGQIWVETAIYTLIAFVLIGAVLAFAKPKIEEMRDRTIIEQSIDMMKTIDDRILNLGIPGNQRVITLNIKQGSLRIDSTNDTLIFEIETSYKYSEEGVVMTNENLQIITLKEMGVEKVKIISNYSSNFNITFNDGKIEKTIGRASNPYTLIIKKGDLENPDSNKNMLDFKIK